MKIHIIGAGPTGMSLAWEILRSGDHDVTIYDRKVSAGGSWWEPDVETRDLHAHRIVFDKAFVNTQSLFSEMNIDWNEIFQIVEKKSIFEFAFKSLGVKDYGTLISLFSRVLAQPQKFKGISLKDAVGPLSEKGRKIHRTLTTHHGWRYMGCHDSVRVCKKFRSYDTFTNVHTEGVR